MADSSVFSRAYLIWVYLQSGFALVCVTLALPLFVPDPAGVAGVLAAGGAVMMVVLYGLGMWSFPGTMGSPVAHILTAFRSLGAVVVLVAVARTPAAPRDFSMAGYLLPGGAAWGLFAFLALVETTDFFDGRVARRAGVQAFGSVWDMENDAFLALALSLGAWVVTGIPAFVLVIGMMRYLYFLVFRVVGDPPNHSRRYKLFARTTAATLMVVLVAVYAPVWSSGGRAALAAGALAMQLASFGWDLSLNIRAGRIAAALRGSVE